MIEEFFSKKNKLEIIRINLSTPFLTRSRCKSCAGFPTIFFYIKNPTLWYSPRRRTDLFVKLTKHIKRMCNNYHIFFDPKYYSGVSNFGHTPNYKGYKPNLHRTRGTSPVQNIVEFLMCNCGATSWAFTDKAAQNHPEITCRKARYKFPNKFEF